MGRADKKGLFIIIKTLRFPYVAERGVIRGKRLYCRKWLFLGSHSALRQRSPPPQVNYLCLSVGPGQPRRPMGDPGPPPAPSRSPSPGPPWSFPSPAAASRSSSSSSCPFSPTAPGSSALFPAHPRGAQEERPPVVTQQQPGGERLGSGPAPGHPPPGHPSSDFKPALGPQQDLNKQQPQQQPPPPPPPSQKRKELKPPPLSPAQLGGSHPPDYHRHPPQQQQQQFSRPTDKYRQQERRQQQQQLQLLGARPPEPPPSLGPLSAAERRAGSERGAPSRAGGPAPADPDVGVAAAASCVNPPPSPPRPRARAEPPPMESPPNSHLLGSPGTLLPGGLGSGFSSLQSPEIPSPHHQSGGGSSSAASPPPPPLPGFGTPWSVQTSSPPPQQTQQPPVSSGGGQISAMPPPSPESETSFYPGIPSSINPAFFQSFSPVSPHNPCAGPFSSPFSAAAPPPPPPPQMNLPQQQQQQQNRRSPVSPQLQHQHQAAAAAAAFLQQRNSYNHHQVPGAERGAPRRGRAPAAPRGGGGARAEAVGRRSPPVRRAGGGARRARAPGDAFSPHGGASPAEYSSPPPRSLPVGMRRTRRAPNNARDSSRPPRRSLAAPPGAARSSAGTARPAGAVSSHPEMAWVCTRGRGSASGCLASLLVVTKRAVTVWCSAGSWYCFLEQDSDCWKAESGRAALVACWP